MSKWRMAPTGGRSNLPLWVHTFKLVTGRWPKNIWIVVDRRINQGDANHWLRPVTAWPWASLAILHAKVRTIRLAIWDVSELVEQDVMVVKGDMTEVSRTG